MDRKRAAMESWLAAHPDGMGFDETKEVAYCTEPAAVLGMDSSFIKVFEGLHASAAAASPVAVKLLEGASAQPRDPYLAVHARVPPHPNVRIQINRFLGSMC